MLPSILRTVVPLLVGLLVGQAARIGLDLDPAFVTPLVTAVVTAVYYAAARWVEEHFPRLGRVLLSLGLTKKQPVYLPPAKAGITVGTPTSPSSA